MPNPRPLMIDVYSEYAYLRQNGCDPEKAVRILGTISGPKLDALGRAELHSLRPAPLATPIRGGAISLTVAAKLKK